MARHRFGLLSASIRFAAFSFRRLRTTDFGETSSAVDQFRIATPGGTFEKLFREAIHFSCLLFQKSSCA